MKLTDAKKDQYRKLAKIEGYRSRSSYKLIELNNKYHIFKRNDIVVDVGCAPGGWCQVVGNLVGPQGRVIGIDIQFVTPIENILFIEGSIDDPLIERSVIELCPNNIDVFLSDLAPKVSGIWQIDHMKQISMSQNALSLCTKILRKDGKAVFKIFEGEILEDFKKTLSRSFMSIIKSKPKASRQKSSEYYFVCVGFQPHAT